MDTRFKTLLAVFVLVGFVVCATEFAKMTARTWGGKVAVATVTEVKDDNWAVCKYEANGIMHTANCYTYSKPRLGDKRTLYCNANNPEEAADAAGVWGAFTGMLALGSTFVVCVFSLKLHKRLAVWSDKTNTKGTRE